MATAKKWVGLTDEEIKHIEETTTCIGNESWLRNLTRNLEARLKVTMELAVQEEREACAELRKTLSAIPHKHIPQIHPAVESALDFYAERIRARSEK